MGKEKDIYAFLCLFMMLEYVAWNLEMKNNIKQKKNISNQRSSAIGGMIQDDSCWLKIPLGFDDLIDPYWSINWIHQVGDALPATKCNQDMLDRSMYLNLNCTIWLWLT